MQQLPASWPAPGAGVVEEPDVLLVFDDGLWPPAQDDCPAGTVRLSSWEIDSAVTGGLLPGQVRGASGISLTEGSATFPHPDAGLIAPWRTGDLGVPQGRRRCRLVATYADPGETGEYVTLGVFQASLTSGSLLEDVHVTLISDAARLRRPVVLPSLVQAIGRSPIDPVFVIDQLGRALGYAQTPMPSAMCLASLPLVGAVYAERGTVTGSTWAAGWVTAGGSLWATPFGVMSGSLGWSPVIGDVYVTLEARDLPAALGTLEVFITDETTGFGSFYLGRTTLQGSGAAVAWVPGLSAQTHRLQVQVHRVSLTVAQVRVRSAYTAAWSAWVSVDMRFSGASSARWEILAFSSSTGVSFRGIQVTSGDDPAVWAAPTAQLEASDTYVTALLVDPVTDGWATIQEVATATFGVATFTEPGVLRYVGRARASGAAPAVATVVVPDLLTDLSWSQDPADVADRTEVLYTPLVDRTVTDLSLTVWEASEVTRVPAHGTVMVTDTIDGTAVGLGSWSRSTTGAETTGSRWDASLTAQGGAAAPAGALTISAKIIGTSTLEITLTNTTAADVFTCDGTGNALLWLRANRTVVPGEQLTLAAGVDADFAQTPVSVTLSYCQTEQQAQMILDWLTTQTQAALYTVGPVETDPDFRLQQLDVVTLVDRDTGLNTRAIITGLTPAGDGESGTTLNLALAVLGPSS